MSSTSLFKWMSFGQQQQQQQQQQNGKPSIDNDAIDEGERYFGLENFGNTCYSNSVMQALYFCKPFRHCVLNYPNVNLNLQQIATPSTHPNSPSVSNTNHSYFPSASSSSTSSATANGTKVNGNASTRINGTANGATTPSTQHESDAVNFTLAPGMEDTLFSSLKDLFWKVSQNKKKSGTISPVNFINKVKKENELFRSSMHQDAHEFLNYTLNTIADDVVNYQKKTAEDKDDSSVKTTWVHQLFEGVFSNETKCLSCETVTSRDESFMDLSIDVEMNSSITSCLRQFSASETLCHKNKYYCDVCSGLQEAERRMKIKKLPNILALHLKRFKYQEKLQKYIKLTYRVVFPFELRLFNTSDDTENADRMYELWGIVVHIGSGPHHGHYVSIIKSNGQWLHFDDDIVTQIQEDDIQKYFSDLPGSGSGYVLFYQAIDLDMGMINIAHETATSTTPEEIKMNGTSTSTTLNGFTPSESTTNDYSPPLPQRKEVPEVPVTPELTQPPQQEEKKSRWGLGRKKKDKK